METIIQLNELPNFQLYNYTGDFNGTKFNFKISMDGKNQIHRFEIEDWDGKEIEDLNIDDVIEIYIKRAHENPITKNIASFMKDERLKKHSNKLWYI